MSVRDILMAAANNKLYVDDVFSAYTYTGSDFTQTINNGIDLAGKGGLVWIKARDYATDNMVVDTVRGVGQYSSLQTNTANSDLDFNVGPDFTSFNSNGFTLGAPAFTNRWNSAPNAYISWTFRKAPKFFDVVTWTGNGANRTIPHALGQEVGMMLVKRTDAATDWQVYHRSLANTEYMVLNSVIAKTTGATRWNSTKPTTSGFRLGTDASVNASGGTYVAYLFAHDPSADGVIQCGVYTGNSSSSGPTVGLGWEPQYVLVKGAGHVTDWWLWDSSRGLTNNGGNVGTDPSLALNQASVDSTSSDNQIRPLSTGFQLRGSGSETNLTGYKYIYLAIRRPNKPPTTGTQVYNAIARTGTDAAATVTGVGFAPDFISMGGRSYNTSAPVWAWMDRLRGGLRSLNTSNTASEVESGYVPSFNMDGVIISSAITISNASETYIDHFFKRAPGFMDVVCDTGTGSAHAIAHRLAVVPGLMIRKKRSAVDNWIVYAGDATDYLILNSAAATADLNTMWNDAAPTASAFTVGTNDDVNQSAGTFVTYLFATLPGISKVGSYTGNGTSQTINCGFTTGARFILIKRTDSTGDWLVADTARGIVSAGDPRLSLNTTDAEVTTEDWLDPDSTGFIVNQIADSNANVNGASYIFLAIA